MYNRFAMQGAASPQTSGFRSPENFARYQQIVRNPYNVNLSQRPAEFMMRPRQQEAPIQQAQPQLPAYLSYLSQPKGSFGNLFSNYIQAVINQIPR